MPKRIILLSDGTGNSAGKLLKTNVWRIYETLDLTDPSRQVACYDDGVGTSAFKPLALLGGAVGIGLRRNVLRLYRFLCEHYDPGDEIFMFGFSRGAFTIRVLLGMICDQGIIRTRPTMAVRGATGVDDADLPPVCGGGVAVADKVASSAYVYGADLVRLTKWVYREHRKKFHPTAGSPVGPCRAMRDVLLGTWEAAHGCKPYDSGKNHEPPPIRFVGLWDTVDAYGLPMDELTAGIDEWVWPLSMRELTLPANVTRACHVLALDDERNTFHPVLWDESGEQAADHLRDERISQVWFAGMHANVGGGYPDDALSYVSLTWMARQAANEGLDFVPQLLHRYVMQADPLGRLYDSRSGLKSYYRYNPRRIEWLTNGQKHEQEALHGHPSVAPSVTIARPKIHESVFQRMAAAPEAYAPIVIPEHYAVVMMDGQIVSGDHNPYEPVAAARRRSAAQERAWDLVWRKRIVYFATVAATALLLLLPFAKPVPAGPLPYGFVPRLIDGTRPMLPAYISPWLDYYVVHWLSLLVLVAIVGVLNRRGAVLQSSICTVMRGVWLKVLPPANDEYPLLDTRVSLLSRLRLNRWYQAAGAILRRWILPNAFGIGVLIWVVAAANRLPFEVWDVSGGFCKGSRQTHPVAGQASVQFPSAAICYATGLRLEEGTRYELTLALSPDWADDRHVVDSPEGFESWSGGLTGNERLKYFLATPFRRAWLERWFAPMARIGERDIDHYPLRSNKTTFVARGTGELFLFVNDNVVPIDVAPLSFGWTSNYRNNHGTAAVSIRKVE